MIKLKKLVKIYEADDDAKAIYIASEIDLIDKAKTNIGDGENEKADIELEKKKKELVGKYKAITGHEDTKKSIPEAKMILEGLLEDLGIKAFTEFGRKYAAKIKLMVAEIGGQYSGYFYDVPTSTIAVATTKGVGYYYFDKDSGEFDQYKIQPITK